MPELLLPDLDVSLVERLEQRAALHGRTMEAEARAILEDAVWSDRARFIAESERLRAQMRGRVHSESADLIRGDRNRDGALW